MCSECLKAIEQQPEFLKEYDRLRGTTFCRAGIAREIDKATGKFDEDLKELHQFIEQRIHAPVFGG